MHTGMASCGVRGRLPAVRYGRRRQRCVDVGWPDDCLIGAKEHKVLAVLLG